MLGQWDDHPSDPSHYIEDCLISKESLGFPIKKKYSDVPEKFSICASDYSRHEFQVLLSPMSTSFGLPNAEWKEFDVWTAHKKDRTESASRISLLLHSGLKS